jgi:hypothetical protein
MPPGVSLSNGGAATGQPMKDGSKKTKQMLKEILSSGAIPDTVNI